MVVESNWVRSENYPTRLFRGFVRAADGSSMQAVLQDPDGNGDGTVPVSSAMFQGSGHRSPGQPTSHDFPELSHQPAYNDENARRWVVCAITALCKIHFKKRHG
jgi:hypothetical protein